MFKGFCVQSLAMSICRFFYLRFEIYTYGRDKTPGMWKCQTYPHGSQPMIKCILPLPIISLMMNLFILWVPPSWTGTKVCTELSGDTRNQLPNHVSEDKIMYKISSVFVCCHSKGQWCIVLSMYSRVQYIFRTLCFDKHLSTMVAP